MENVSEKPFSRFDEMERYIEVLENQVNRSYYRSTFDSKIAELEKELNEKENTN
jgi:environmental stress-induced protein Ves